MTDIVTSKDTMILTEDERFDGWGIDVSTNLKSKKVILKIEYAATGFREMQNYRAFGLLSLWSQIGGFVGIFLGYSLLQVPELVNGVIGWAK